jgi:hypothetical protein
MSPFWRRVHRVVDLVLCSRAIPVSAVSNCRDLRLAMNAAVSEVATEYVRRGVGAHFHKGGTLARARGKHCLSAPNAAFAGYSRLGLQGQHPLFNE